MRALNFKYRKKNYPTDILSFPAEKTFRRTGTLGELVICQPVLRRQAKEHAHSEKVELDVLLVHGLLHLLGLDHEKGGRETSRMRRLEKQLLEQLGRVESSLIERS